MHTTGCKHHDQPEPHQMQAATASAAQCMTSFLWGTVSDHTGRKVRPGYTVRPTDTEILLLLPYSCLEPLCCFAHAACADGGQHFRLPFNPGAWSCTQLQCSHTLTLHWRPFHIEHWSVSLAQAQLLLLSAAMLVVA